MACLAGLYAVREVPPPAKPHWTVQSIIDRSNIQFSRSRFYKPTSKDSELQSVFSPLIVEQFRESRVHQVQKIRSASSIQNPQVDETNFELLGHPTVYHYLSTVESGEVTFDAQGFVWLYVDYPECLPQLKPRVLVRGVRIVLGSDGLPSLWEALSDEYSPRVFFVSQSLEEAARAQYGDPLPGRNFSIERGLIETANVVVAKILDDGPVPMGPYVYEDASSRRSITTVHCRCSPSQFDEVVETVCYQLEPLESLDKKWLREHGGVDLDKLLNPEPLDKLFRWPKL